MKKSILVLALVVAVVGIAYTQRVAIKDRFFEMSKEPLPQAVSFEDFQKAQEEAETIKDSRPANTSPTKPVEPTTPIGTAEPSDVVDQDTSDAPTAVATTGAVNLAVPFQTQAPHGNWQLPYKEACEEASIIMVDYYLQGKTISADQMDAEILKLVAWEEEQGYAIDVSIVEMAKIVEAHYPYSAEVITIQSAEDIYEQLRTGHPVIIPFAGQEVGNPFYTQPGPLYHVLVVKGMTESGDFITNDPGTRRGADYVYEPSIILSAIGDWDGSAPEGPKRGLVITPR